MNRWLKGFAAAALALVIAVSGGALTGGMIAGAENAGANAESAGVDLSGVTAQLLAGGSADASLFAKAKLTMVNVWATYCGPCLNEMPDLALISETWKDSGVQIVGVVSDALDFYAGKLDEATVANAKVIARYTKAEYPHLLPSASLITSLLAGMEVVPTTVFVDAQGRQVGETVIGSQSKDAWEDEIRARLALLTDAQD